MEGIQCIKHKLYDTLRSVSTEHDYCLKTSAIKPFSQRANYPAVGKLPARQRTPQARPMKRVHEHVQFPATAPTPVSSSCISRAEFRAIAETDLALLESLERSANFVEAPGSAL